MRSIREAVRRLAVEPSRLVLGVCVVGAAIVLILLFEGFRTGLYAQLRDFPEQLPTPLVAVQAGVSRLFAERSVLPGAARAEIESVPGVRGAYPVAGIPLIYSREGHRTPIFVVAYDIEGAPRRLVAGRQIAAAREIVVDSALAAGYGLGVGSDVNVLGVTFRVVGVSSGTAAMFTPYVFARYVDLVDLYLSGEFEGVEPSEQTSLLSYLLIELAPGADPARVRAAIERRAKAVDVLTRAELADRNVETGRQMLGPVLLLLLGIAYGIGALVVGLTMYGAVAARIGELAVEKAIGATNRRLVVDVVAEVVVVCGVAFAVALALAGGVAALIEWWAPVYFVVPWAAAGIARTAVASAGIAALGALAPLRRVAAVDPGLAFRG